MPATNPGGDHAEVRRTRSRGDQYAERLAPSPRLRRHRRSRAPRPARPPPALQYGPSLDLNQARKVVAAAEARRPQRKVQITMAVVDNSGMLIYFQKAANGPNTAEEFAVKKARAAARSRYPTTYDAARWAAGVTALATVEALFPFGGGQPIVQGGKVVGAHRRHRRLRRRHRPGRDQGARDALTDLGHPGRQVGQRGQFGGSAGARPARRRLRAPRPADRGSGRRRPRPPAPAARRTSPSCRPSPPDPSARRGARRSACRCPAASR